MQNKGSHCSIFPPDLSALTLHILAMAFMFCDHLWATLAGDAWWLTGIGRLAFPMFAFFLVEGFFHTHDRKKYCMRLLLLAILSELPINLMYSGLLFYPFHQNVIWTLLTGFLCIWAIDTLRKNVRSGCGFRRSCCYLQWATCWQPSSCSTITEKAF